MVAWAVEHRIGTLAMGDPRGLLQVDAGRRHNRRIRTWQPARLIHILSDKATQAGLTVRLVDERAAHPPAPPAGNAYRNRPDAP